MTTTTTTTTTPTCTIPSINLQPFFVEEGVVVGKPPTKDQKHVASQINQACQEHGFVYVTNFGLSKEYGEGLFRASKELFDHPTKHKDYTPWHPSHNTGYSSYRNESLNTNRQPDLKEAFNVRFPPIYENPSLPKTPQGYQNLVNNEKYFELMRTMAIRYGYACALALDLPMDTFSKTLQKFDLCTIRFLHYPPCTDYFEGGNDESEKKKKQKAIRVGEHTDFGAYTFLFLKNGPMGLQVKSVEGGEIGGQAGGEEDDSGWKDVVIQPSFNDDDTNSFGAVINTGAMMARWTNDYWKATAHRVIVPNKDIASKDRYSVAFFVDPDSEEIIAVDQKYINHSNKGSSRCYEPIKSKDFLAMKLQEMALGKK